MSHYRLLQKHPHVMSLKEEKENIHNIIKTENYVITLKPQFTSFSHAKKTYFKNKYIYYYFLSLYPETITNDKHIQRPSQMINIEP